MESTRSPLGPFPIPVVIDTCVFARVHRWLRPLLQEAAAGHLLPLWSPYIIAESNRLLTWRWLARNGSVQNDATWTHCSESAKAMFTRLTPFFRVVDDYPPYERIWTETPKDEWDTPMWVCATRGKAKFLISDNLQDGPPKAADGLREWDGIFMLDPEAFLSFLQELVEVYEAVSLPAERELEPPLPSFVTASFGDSELPTCDPSFRRFLADGVRRWR